MSDLEKTNAIYASRNELVWNAGFDCGRNGANTKNCHFGWFNTPERTHIWEEGKRAGEAEKAQGKE